MTVVDEENEGTNYGYWRRPVDSTIDDIYITPSKPPSYISPNSTTSEADTDDSSIHNNVDGRLRYSEIVQELNAYYRRQSRLRNGMSRLIFNVQQRQQREEDDDTLCMKYKYAFQSCVLTQFKGVFMLVWILSLLILGIVSVALSGLPKGFQALWIPLLVYIILVVIVNVRRRKEEERIEKLEKQFEIERRRMIQQALLEQRKFSLPNDHFFEIQTNVDGHAHPVVTLLPPPPTYIHT